MNLAKIIITTIVTLRGKKQRYNSRFLK